MDDKLKTIFLISIVAFVTIAIVNRISPLRAWLSTDAQPPASNG